MVKKQKLIITGAAGAVGQNLIKLLEKENYEIIAIDKHKYNLGVLKKLRPKVVCVLADVSERGSWEKHFKGADILISLQAQISSKHSEDFIKNTVRSQEILCEVCKKYKVPYIIHVSSSVVLSVANDDYTRTKREQEEIVKKCGIDYVILRPTLMFGLYDKKHLTFLANFLEQAPIFPVPGDGKYIRQPVYIPDFCKVVKRCVEKKPKNKIYNIIGKEKIYYIDIIKAIRKIKGLKKPIVHIPVWLFKSLLKIYAVFVRDPPFTADQLQALVNNDVFKVSPWWRTFKVKPTPFEKAMREMLTHPDSKIVLKR